MKNLKQKPKILFTEAVLLGIFVYQKIFSPDQGILGSIFSATLPFGFGIKNCRFFPSCSEYAGQALRQHGLLKGSVASFIRILKCNPWQRGGYDPVN